MVFEIKAGVTFLISYRYYIPTFPAKVVIFLTGALAFSATVTIVASIVIGEFTPVGAIGGLAGVVAYNALEGLALRYAGVRDLADLTSPAGA